jgi:hypothetical protein
MRIKPDSKCVEKKWLAFAVFFRSSNQSINVLARSWPSAGSERVVKNVEKFA